MGEQKQKKTKQKNLNREQLGAAKVLTILQVANIINTWIHFFNFLHFNPNVGSVISNKLYKNYFMESYAKDPLT